MPTIYQRPSMGLGSLFGGEVSSLNFNFQTGGESSSATLTVFNKENVYQEPSLGEKVRVYPWGIEMSVVEFGLVDDSNFKFLQIELVDSTAEILDKNVITIRGVHSTGLKEDVVNKEVYYWFDNSVLPTDATSKRVIGNEFFSDASSNIGIANVSPFVWLMGRIRGTYRPSGEIFWNNGFSTWNPSESPIWLKFEAGQLRRDLSRWNGSLPNSTDINNLLREEGVSSVEYGYTLSDLKSLILKLGLQIQDNDIMSDDRILFSSSGSIRNCLSSALSSIGRTFYIDPRSKKIKIISNADITKINSSLQQKIGQLSQIAGAEQVSYIKSLRGISGKHVVVKGDLQQHIHDPSQFENTKKPRRAVFRRIPIDGLFNKELDSKEGAFIRKVLYLIANQTDESVIDKYLYGLAQLEDTAQWSSESLMSKVLYGKPHIQAGTLQSLSDGGRWKDFVTNNITKLSGLDGYSLSKTVGARPLIRNGKYDDSGETVFVDSTLRATSGSRAGLYEFLRGINQLWAGVYISPPTTLNRINKRSYLESGSVGRRIGGQSLSLTFLNVAADTYLSEVPELSFLQQSIIRAYPNRSDLKISDLASIAGHGYGGTPLTEAWHTLAFRKNFYPETDDPKKIGNISKYINRNFYLVETPESDEPTLWLLYTSDAANAIKEVRSICENSFDKEVGTVKDKITVLYDTIKIDNRRTNESEDNSDSDIDEQPKIFSLKTIPTEAEIFERGEVILINGDFLETSLFLQEIDEISPQVKAPMISSEIKFYRPPLNSDLDVESGTDSVSVSVDENGVSTTVRFSSLKYNEIDQSILTDYFGAGRVTKKIINSKRRFSPAFIKNFRRD